MGKVKRPARRHSNHNDNPKSNSSKVVRRQHSQHKRLQPPKAAAQKASNDVSQQRRLKVPYTKRDNVLLVGEGSSKPQPTPVLKVHLPFLFKSTQLLTRVQETSRSLYP